MADSLPLMGDRAPEVEVDPFEETGVTGLDRSGFGFGYVQEEWLRDLRGQRQALDKYREVSDNSATVAAVLFLMDSLIRGLKWEVDKGSRDDEAAEVQAEFVQSCMDDLRQSWPNLIGEIIRNVVVYGWDTQELVYKRRKGATDNLKTTSDFDDGKNWMGGNSTAKPRQPRRVGL